MASSRYVPLTDVWPAHGLVSVVLACLTDAGFHPLSECDSRGWFYVRGWPLGSQRPTTLWVPEQERDLALAFLDAPFDAEEPEVLESAGLWAWVAAHRRGIFVAWLAMILLNGM